MLLFCFSALLPFSFLPFFPPRSTPIYRNILFMPPIHPRQPRPHPPRFLHLLPHSFPNAQCTTQNAKYQVKIFRLCIVHSALCTSDALCIMHCHASALCGLRRTLPILLIYCRFIGAVRNRRSFLSSLGRSLVAHSQIVRTRQPALLRAFRCRLSRSTF